MFALVNSRRFRTPNLTPQNTISTTEGSTLDDVPSSNPSPVSTGNGDRAIEQSSFDIPTDAPPAYTPTADPSQGEAPLEFGPSRAFQPPPPQPSLTINANRSESSVSDQPRATYAPPPRHPSVISHSAATANLREPLPQQQQGMTYLPPPGPPPSHSSSRNEFSNRPSSVGGVPENDGRPTTIATPGHPLLREGTLIVYPRGYECSKCHNTGYKSFDPSNPCRKCWQKYARPYRGPLTYAPFSPSSSSSQAAGNLQRPLPLFKPPHAAPLRPHSTCGYPGQNYRLSVPPQPASPSGYPGQNYRLSVPPQSASPSGYTPPPLPPRPQLQFLPPPGPPPMPFGPFPHSAPGSPIYAAPPPFPTPLIVPPGDPRIGGRLCWRCDGKGRVSFLLFDSQICDVCRGAGRVFP